MHVQIGVALVGVTGLGWLLIVIGFGMETAVRFSLTFHDRWLVCCSIYSKINDEAVSH